MKTSEKTDIIFKLLFQVKKELGPVTKGSVNPHFKNSYADLNQHLETIEPVLEKHGLFMLQPVSVNAQGENELTTQVIHAESGQWLSTSMVLVNTPDMQKLLAAVTYARRGSQNALFGLTSLDDDGESAVGRGAPAKQWSKPAQSKAAPQSAPKQSASSALKEEPKPFTREMAKPKAEAAEVASKPEAKASKGVVW